MTRLHNGVKRIREIYRDGYIQRVNVRPREQFAEGSQALSPDHCLSALDEVHRQSLQSGRHIPVLELLVGRKNQFLMHRATVDHSKRKVAQTARCKGHIVRARTMVEQPYLYGEF